MQVRKREPFPLLLRHSLEKPNNKNYKLAHVSTQKQANIRHAAYRRFQWCKHRLSTPEQEHACPLHWAQHLSQPYRKQTVIIALRSFKHRSIFTMVVRSIRTSLLIIILPSSLLFFAQKEFGCSRRRCSSSRYVKPKTTY